jgi:hypothetical protein
LNKKFSHGEIVQNILFHFVKAATLILGLFLTTPVVAQQVPQVPPSVTHGIFRPRESSFFKEGREKFEKEIQRLNQRRSLSDKLLKIRLEKIERQEKRSHQQSPGYYSLHHRPRN